MESYSKKKKIDTHMGKKRREKDLKLVNIHYNIYFVSFYLFSSFKMKNSHKLDFKIDNYSCFIKYVIKNKSISQYIICYYL